MRIDRRGFLAATGAGVAGAATLTAPSARATEPGTDPFALGVASGDATWSNVVLWTRLAPAPLDPDGSFGMTGDRPRRVHWSLAPSPHELTSRRHPVRQGVVTAAADHGYAVHVDVAGLRPDTTYYYRFEAAGRTSPIGRTRTAPAPGQKREIRFAVVNCQNLAAPDAGGEPVPMYLHGLSHLAQRDDIDFVLYLGDYIYDFGRGAHVPPREVVSLDDYRTRYGQYKLVAALQEVHRRFPTYSVPDDHEYFDNVTGGALEPGRIDQFNNAVVAYWEHQPLRTRPTTRPGSGGTQAVSQLTCHRRIRWGSLLDPFLVDVRQYASAESVLGPEQNAAFLSWLARTDSTWTAIGSGFPFAFFGSGGEWPGYPRDRAAVTDLLARRKAADASGFNAVVLSGDLH